MPFFRKTTREQYERSGTGEESPHHKLAATQVAIIKMRRGERSKEWLAHYFGVSPSTIQSIWDEETWKEW